MIQIAVPVPGSVLPGIVPGEGIVPPGTVEDGTVTWSVLTSEVTVNPSPRSVGSPPPVVSGRFLVKDWGPFTIRLADVIFSEPLKLAVAVNVTVSVVNMLFGEAVMVREAAWALLGRIK